LARRVGLVGRQVEGVVSHLRRGDGDQRKVGRGGGVEAGGGGHEARVEGSELLTGEASASDAVFTLYIWTNMRPRHATPWIPPRPAGEAVSADLGPPVGRRARGRRVACRGMLQQVERVPATGPSQGPAPCRSALVAGP